MKGLERGGALFSLFLNEMFRFLCLCSQLDHFSTEGNTSPNYVVLINSTREKGKRETAQGPACCGVTGVAPRNEFSRGAEKMSTGSSVQKGAFLTRMLLCNQGFKFL